MIDVNTMSVMITVAKLTLTATLLYILAEIAKRSTSMASLLASIPVTTILAGILLYWETGDTERVAAFTSGVLWLIYPSLIFFVAFPYCLRRGMSFSLALLVSISIMVIFYAAYAALLRWLSIKL